MATEEIKRAMVEADRESKRRQSRNAVIMLLVAVAIAIAGAFLLLPLIPK